MAKFKKGESGNPAGKPKGLRDCRTLMMEMLDKAGTDEGSFTSEVIALAKKGNATALAVIAERLWPKSKAIEPALELPECKERSAVAEALVESMSNGTIAPDQAATAMSVLRQAAELTDMADILDRLKLLEAA